MHQPPSDTTQPPVHSCFLTQPSGKMPFRFITHTLVHLKQPPRASHFLILRGAYAEEQSWTSILRSLESNISFFGLYISLLRVWLIWVYTYGYMEINWEHHPGVKTLSGSQCQEEYHLSSQQAPPLASQWDQAFNTGAWSRGQKILGSALQQ